MPSEASKDQYLKVTRPRNDCLLCSKPLNVDGKHASLIELSGTEEVIRKDFCPECWQRISEQGYFSFWITNRVNKPSAQERRLAKAERNEALWRLFAALQASDREGLAPQLFLLAHLLMKYKVLGFGGTTPEGRLKFVHPRLEETFIIDDIPIDSVDFVEIKKQVEEQALNFAPGADDAEQETTQPES